MIRVRTLGQCTIEIDDVRIGPDAEIVFATLLLLTIEPGRRVTRGELLGMLWPDIPSPRASHCLRQTIYRLRTLGVELNVDHGHLTIPAPHIDSDVHALHRASGSDQPGRIAEQIGGPFLPGYAAAFSEPLRDWVERQRDLVTSAARRVFVAALTARKSRGEWAQLEGLARRCLSFDPLNEDATLALAEGAALHGSKAEAMAILDNYLREMGPSARELRGPATALRRRICEPEPQFPLPPPIHVPFVGRSEEMIVLSSALKKARTGVGSVYYIHGEPGIGKTRLVTEFTRAAALEGVRIAVTQCQSSDMRRPLSAFVDLVPKLMSMPGALGCSPQSHMYLRRLVEHHSSEAPPTPDTSEAVLLYSNVRRSLFDLFDAIASECSVILGIEDVHWLDPASREVIAEAVPWIKTRRMIIVLTSRDPEPRYSHTAALADSPDEVLLGPIDRRARAALLAATLQHSPHPVTEAFRVWCVEMSGGNPYYLTELALHGLVTDGDFAVPPSLASLVAKRVARLRPSSCRVLQACAVLGRKATLERLERVVDQQRLILLDSLDELEHLGLIEWDETKVSSRHDLLAQAAIARLSALSRRLLHRHAALALEADLVDDVNPSLAWACAEHWTCAGSLERGVRIVLKCARQALELGRPRDAIEVLTNAKALPVAQAERLDLRAELLYAYRAADRWHDAVAEFTELRALRGTAAHVHDETELIGIQAQWMGGVAIETVLAQIIGCCQSTGASPNHRLAAAQKGLMIADNLQDYTAARQIFRLVEADLFDDDLRLADRLACRLFFESSFGDRRVARETIEQLVKASTHIPPREQAAYLVHAAYGCDQLGIVDRIEELATLGYRIAEQCSFGTMACSAARKLAWHNLDRDDVTCATRWYEIARSWLERGQFSGYRGDVYGIEAEILIKRGQYADAQTVLEKCPKAWKETVHPRWKLSVLASHCAIWLATGEREKCEAAVNEYRELFIPVIHEEGNDIYAARFYRLLSLAGCREEAEIALQQYLATRFKAPRHYAAELTSVIRSSGLAPETELARHVAF